MVSYMSILDRVCCASRAMRESWLFGLYFGCPNNQCIRQMTCIMKTTEADRGFVIFEHYVHNMSDEELNALLNHHFKCSDKLAHGR